MKDYNKIINKIFEIPRNYKIPNQMKGETEKIINQLYHEILNSEKLNYFKPVIRNGLGSLIHSSNYTSIPIEIREDIEPSKFINESYNVALRSGRLVKLYFIYEADSIKRNFINESYEKIVLWLSCIDRITSMTCSKNLTLYLLLGTNKKVLPRNRNEEIDRQHVNSAFTFSCKENNEIFVYRYEELFKVFVHESFHAFGIDFSSMDCNLANKIVTNNFQGLDKKSDYRIYESYCETWAQIINILVNCLKNKTSNHMNLINEYLFYERLWSVFQCGKVLHHYGLEYDDLFEKEIVYLEKKTNVFSYFILRAIAMNNFNEFINWSDNNNSNIIVFVNNQENVKSYCNLLCKLSKTKKFKEELMLVKEWFMNGNITKRDVIPLKSMRMSIS